MTSFFRTRRVALYGLGVLALPWLLAIVNPLWLNNSPGDWDVWMYYGYFNHLFSFSNYYIWPANAYIGTRITFVLPGYIIHAVFGDQYYKSVFGIAVTYTTIALSYYYVLRKYLPLEIAASVTVLVALDFFLLRSIGWDHVDKGEAAYEALTFACLTWAGTSRRPWIAAMAAGFMAACMLFIHLGTIILFPVFFLYSGYLVRQARTSGEWVRHAGYLALFGGLGAGLAQLVFGSLMIGLHGGAFFFILSQVKVVGPNLHGQWNDPLSRLLVDSHWMTVHIAAFVGASAVLAASYLRFGKVELTRFEKFWLGLIVIGYAFLFFCEADGLLYYFSRDGMHSTIFLPISMIGFGILLFRRPMGGLFALTATVAAASVLLRLGIRHGDGLSAFFVVPVAVLGVAAGGILAAAFVVGRRGSTIAALLLIGLLGCFDGWHFTDDRTVLQAHARIAADVRGRLPTIFYDRQDPQLLTIWGILSSFTDRALPPSRDTYPLLRDGLQPGDAVAVLSSTESDPEAVRKVLLHYVKDIILVDRFLAGDVKAYVFSVGPAAS
jgi:hypothetical protein